MRKSSTSNYTIRGRNSGRSLQSLPWWRRPTADTFVRMSGPADAPPLVLLPGAATTSLMWVPNIKALSGPFRTYAVDNIYDYGRSVYTRPVKGPDDFVNWLDGLFSALALGDAINVMGLSYGGWLTSQYVLRFPNRLAKVVLIAPARTVLPIRLSFLLRVILIPIAVSFLYQKVHAMDVRGPDTGR